MIQNIISFKNVSKNYSGNYVLKNINFEIKAGEIHALVGENGAGKSTLMNILFGMPVIQNTGGFEGCLFLGEKSVNIKSPFQAMEFGIGMVHQEFMLIPGFTITENVKINREINKDGVLNKILGRVFGKRFRILDYKKMNKDTRKALDTLEMGIEEYTLLAGLPIGHMQFVEIAREIDKTNVRLLVLDEPTAVLTESEAENLIKAMKNLTKKGISIIFISHRLDEIVQAADRVTVLRDGEHVVTKNIADTNVIELAGLMVGREVTIDRSLNERSSSNEIILSVKGLEVVMPGERVRGIDLEIRKGEIFGIGGLAGQGKLGIANGIVGIYPGRGEVNFEGKPLPLNQPKQVLKRGIAYLSEDRKGVGLLLDESIELNIAFTAMQIHNDFLFNLGLFKLKNSMAIRNNANKQITDLDIRCQGPLQNVGRLSGGNQQKVCVARALTQNPKFLFVCEPTRGIDIGAKKLILDLLYKLSNEFGMTIVMTSSELAELRSICDRIAIVCEGKLAGILKPDAPATDFGLMMSGVKGAALSC
ncbi:MAG: sugar ABC transporter ATP-binding protein [Treponema sp.]|jgi:simple sugar transport system ATP-binding protein|nr:sugar ABC transporter ATP-binding protein [Treponema sp.]